ncbi:fimbrial protein [Herbaspirillum sp.]|uniref:fimbrial protein n=1 Tax=Herbaspirillum sp. TaxID=1890675 RepID=UPI001AFD0A31|nr:fimbrial protein [Herbaspirillum sp.]MBO9537921.1 type 1 fimbrial protein [Herbaspirillum sp.]
MWNWNESIARIAARLGLMLLIWMSAEVVNAQTVCRYQDNNPYGPAMFDAAAPLTITALTIGPDVPYGTVLYNQTLHARGSYVLYCPAAVTSLVNNLTLPVRPRVLSSWNTGRFAGKVYETGVAGIGVAIWRGGSVFPDSFTSNNPGNYTWYIPDAFDISLVKIGPISPGIIVGSNLPTAQFDINGIGLARTRFTGNIRIVSQTCTTPDVIVPLGDYKVSDFPTVGNATPWKDFSIRLQNCPAFYGGSATLHNTDSATGWVESNKTVNPNVLQFSLEATNGTTALFPGTVRLSPAASGPASATGIGVQIVDQSLTPVKFLTLMPTNITPTDVSGASYTIPLQARYIRIAGALAPGPANTAVTFTINYQ